MHKMMIECHSKKKGGKDIVQRYVIFILKGDSSTQYDEVLVRT